MSKYGSERQSNIELLRVFSMLFIVIYHFFIHAIIPKNPDWNYFTTPAISVLHIGVICFILISGYWGIKFSLKSLFKLIVQCCTYSTLIYLTFALINPEQFNIKGLIKSFVPSQWWFINIYLCLILIAPIINIPLKTASSSKKIFYIIILTIISFLFQFVAPSLSDGKNPINFILIYYIGNFIRHDLKITQFYSVRKLVGIYIIYNIILFTSLYFLSSNIFLKNLLFRITFPYNSIGLIFNAILFFLIFHKLEFKSRAINWIAISILPVYLIHENQYIGNLYLYPMIKNLQDYINNPIIFMLSILLLGIFVVCTCVILDKLISILTKFIERCLFNTRLFKKYNDRVSNILE